MRNSSVHIPTSPGFHLIDCFLVRWMKLYTFLLFSIRLPNGHSRQMDIDLTSILRRYVVNQISVNFHVISMNCFDVISLIEKSTSFPRTFFDVISLIEKSASFPRTFFRRNFDGRKIHVASTYIIRRNFDGRKTLFVSTYYFQCNSDGQVTHVVSTYFSV